MSEKWFRRKKRVFQIIEVGYDLDFMSRAYDFINVFAILLNVLVSVLYTFEDIKYNGPKVDELINKLISSNA